MPNVLCHHSSPAICISTIYLLSSSSWYSVAQAASILENSMKDCKYFANWCNASINGIQLSAERMQDLRSYTIPTSGSLRIDYVTYQVIAHVIYY